MLGRRTWTWTTGAVALALAVSACGSSASSTAPSASPAGSSGSAAGGSAGSAVDAAKAEVAKYSGPVSNAPTGAPLDISSLKGKTVTYVPIGLSIPYFQTVLAGVQAAGKAAGVTISPCDPKFSPSGVAQCLAQAANQQVGAVILDTVPLDFAGQAVDTLKSRGIPIVVAEEAPSVTDPLIGYVSPDTNKQEALAADWIIADSGGKANILLPEITDNSSSTGYAEDGSIPEIKTKCPGCSLTVVKTNTEQLANLPSLVSTELVKNPKIDYVLSEFDVDVSGIIQGLQTVSGGRNVKVTGINGVLQNLQSVKQGNFQVADIGDNGYQLGWAVIDQAFRLQLKQAPATGEPVGLRVFTAANVSGLSLTPQAANTGEWYGSTGFAAAYAKLWGVG